MAVLPPIRRLLIEDFASQKAWIEPLLLVENQFAEQIVNALNKNLTLHDNTTGDVLTITLSSVPTAVSPASINWPKTVTPRAILVGQAAYTNGSFPVATAALGIQWQMNGNAIQVTNFFGPSPTNIAPITITLVVLTG